MFAFSSAIAKQSGHRRGGLRMTRCKLYRVIKELEFPNAPLIWTKRAVNVSPFMFLSNGKSSIIHLPVLQRTQSNPKSLIFICATHFAFQAQSARTDNGIENDIVMEMRVDGSLIDNWTEAYRGL